MEKYRIFKKSVSLFLACILFLSLFYELPVKVFASEGGSMDDFTYQALNGTYCTITKYTGTAEEVLIPSELDGYIVQKISADAFRDNQTLKKVVLPETVESVESGIFSGCTSLTYVGLNSTLTNIGNSMFYGCTALNEITLPVGITSIGNYAFYGCSGLTTINLPETLVSIDYYAFGNCTGLESITLPDSVTGISGRAFDGCTNLTSVTLPVGWNTVNVSYNYGSETPFRGCTKLTEIALPEGMTKVPEYAFSGCTSLTQVTLPESITEIGRNAFNGCTGLNTLDLPDSLTTIGNYAFNDCTGMTEITLPDSLTTIEDGAFQGCTGLKSITIPNQVTKIDPYVFYGCSSLTTINLPETLVSIDYYAFGNCTGLESITLPDSVTGISGRAFNNCSNLSSVTLPVGWSTVNVSYNYSSETPFRGCTKLTEITLPEGMTTVPDYAFSGCTSLTKVTLPESITEIGRNAFSGCTGLNTLDLPDSLTTIGNYAFNGCTGLTSVTIPSQVTKLNPYVFYGCSGLTEVNLPETLVSIDYYAFGNCTGLESIVLPDSVTGISGRAFSGCTSLSSVTLPVGWNTVFVSSSSYGYETPFPGCTKLTEITLPEGMTKVPEYAFSGCTSLTQVILPESITEIGRNAFNGCTKLTQVWIPQSVTTIGDNAFWNCSSLTIHGIEGSYAQEYAQANEISFSTETLTYETATLSGRIVDEDGNGVANVQVSLYDVIRKRLMSNVTVTDEEGNWSYSGAIVGNTYAISFYNPYYQIAKKENVAISSGENTVEQILAVKVLGETTTPTSDFTYQALNGTYCTITKYTGTAEEVLIPSEIDGYIVQKISSDAFRDNKTLKKVVLPETVESVESRIFYGCTSLTYVGLNSTLTNIGNSMFYGCTVLSEITLPVGITSIGNYAFYGCSSLSTINLPDTLASIDYYAFGNCTGLESITLPDSVTGISGRAFNNCSNLSSVTLPVGWSTVNVSYNYGSETPFRGCTKLTEITLPEGMTKVPDYAFSGCTSLTQVILAESITEIGRNAFSGCTGLTEITLPDSLTTIEDGAFQGCTGLKSITIPNQITKIDPYVFYGCSSLTTINLPETLVSIDYYAFGNCTGLESIVLPDSVTGISGRAFDGCTNLSSVTLPVEWNTVNVSYNYGSETPFRGCTKLTEIALPEGMTKVPEYAFSGCTSLTQVTLPESITEIGRNAFSGCTGLNTLDLLDSLTTIGDYAFNGCTGMTEITLPDSLTTIEDGAFQGCTGLTSIVIPSQVTKLNPYVFYGCSGLIEVNLPETLVSIDYYAFGNCTGLESIVLPDSVTGISGRAFDGCTNLSSVTLPVGWNTVNVSYNYSSETPFRGCTKLTEITLPEGMTKVPDYAFSGCTSLTQVILAESVTEIGNSTFNGCTKLAQVWIPQSVTTIGDNAFWNCSSLTIHGMEGSYAQEYAQANEISFSTETLTYETATLLGRIVDEDGNGVANVQVSLYDVIRKRLMSNVTVTDEEGNWSYSGAIVGNTYAISFYNPYYQIAKKENVAISSGENTVEQILAVRVLGETTTPTSDFTYQALNGTYCTITKYTGTAEEVLIPSEIDGYIVQKISSDAFRDNQTLKKVVLPETVESVESGIFSGCTSLTYVGLNSTLTNIGNSMFYGCTALSEITLPVGITSIGNYAFYGCSSLSTINLPDTLASIDYYAFGNCTGLESITLPDSVTGISGRAFNNCSNLSSVTLPVGWNTVNVSYNYGSETPFRGCTKLTEIALPEGMTKVPEYAFSGCTSLTQVTLAESITEIGRNAFSGCTGLSTLDLPNSLTTIGNYAFNDCTGITEITLPDSLTTIEDGAFQGCTGLKSITIPNQITKIDPYVFYGCSGLIEVNLPETLVSIDYYAFGNCTGLESITLPDSVTGISGRAFSGCTSLSSVTLPVGWSTVNVSYNYSSETPFRGCTKLTEITLPEGMTKVPEYAFSGCTSLTQVILPESITEIGNSSFNGCTGLSTLEFPDSLRTIESSAFSGCIGFRMLNFNEDLEFIGPYAFSGCNGLVSLVLNEKLITLSNRAFANCENLTAARVPKSVTSFDADSFYNCPKLTIYCYSGSAAHMVLENTSYSYFLLDNHEHVYETVVETAATCTRGGSQIKTCTLCGYNYIELVDPLGHEYEAVQTAATCTEQGYTTYTCTRCGDTYQDDFLDALGHTYSEWTVETEPSCTHTGSQYRICSVCGYKEIQTIAALEHSYTSVVVPPTCDQQGYTVYTCSVCGYSYKDDYVGTSDHVYGEWIVDQPATVLAEGSRHRSCTKCGHTETQVIPSITIDIDTNDSYGLAKFTVVNAQTLKPIENAQIFVSTEKDGENTFKTDAQGQASVILPVGSQMVSVYAAGCLTRNINITISAGINEIQQIGLSDQPTYDAQITSEEMTIDEIKEAGIDTSDPSNQHVYKYELKLEFEPEVDVSSIIAYFNADGTYLGGYSPDNIPGGEGSDGEAGTGEPTYNLHYHVVNDGYWHSWCKDVEVELGEHAVLSYHPWRDNDDYVFDGWYEDETFTKKIYSVDIQQQTTYVYGRWIYIGEGEEPENVVGSGGIRVPVKDDVVTVYPVKEYFYLIVRGEVTWLKEMFDVEMLVINNSMTDTLENLTATLNLPEGLSLAKMVGEQQNLSQTIDHIDKGESESVHWYVRGDTAGNYNLEARLQGTVMPFEEPIDDVFVAENQLQVWAGNALHLDFEFPNAAYYGEDYPITITLTNVSDITLYNVNHLVQIEQGMEIYYSDGTSKEKIEKSSWESIGVKAFHPGDKIIMETSVNIFFESEMMEKQLEDLIGMVDGIEQLMNAFKAVQTAIDASDALLTCVSDCSNALDTFNFSSGGNMDKLQMFQQLHGAISSLMSSYATSGNKAIDAAIGLANSGISASLDAIASDPDEWFNSHSIEDIEELFDNVTALEDSIINSSETSQKFDIFDSIRTAISAIPIRFSLKNVIMTEDENNTTSIPWSYSVSDASVQYFGVTNVSKYLTSLTQAALGQAYDESMPWYLQLIPGLDDPFNREAAIQYIQATENEIEQFKAKDATGEVTFKAWVERNDVETARLLTAASISETNDFLLYCDNETATYENGVLTFTGDGMISVVPQTLTGGTLYVEDSEGNVYTYVIDVVEQHECAAGERQVIIPPTVDYDGFAVKCCETCGEIMEIIPLYSEDCCVEHDFGEWVTELEATCIEKGIQTKTCTSCGKVEYQFIEMTDHSYGPWEIVTEATCTAQGEEKAICTICGEEISRSIEIVPHTEGEWIVVKEATALEEGLKELRCSVCNATIRTESIPKIEDENQGQNDFRYDINQDGEENVLDVMALAQIVVGKSSIDDYELVDYDENHMLDLLDVMYLVQKVADKKE